jgi:prevent-host-death family protein
MYMTIMVGVAEARAQLAELLERASTEPVFISRRGRRVAALVDADTLDRLLELAEDAEDIRDAQAARDEMAATQSEPIPWDEVKAELGLA